MLSLLDTCVNFISNRVQKFDLKVLPQELFETIIEQIPSEQMVPPLETYADRITHICLFKSKQMPSKCFHQLQSFHCEQFNDNSKLIEFIHLNPSIRILKLQAELKEAELMKLFEHTHLIQLNLSSNNAVTIPQNIQNQTQLKALTLDLNMKSNFGPVANCTSLTSLKMRDVFINFSQLNQLSSFDVFAPNTSKDLELFFFNLEQSPITQLNLLHVNGSLLTPTMIASLKKIEILTINIKNSAETFIKNLGQLEALHDLSLEISGDFNFSQLNTQARKIEIICSRIIYENNLDISPLAPNLNEISIVEKEESLDISNLQSFCESKEIKFSYTNLF